MAYEGSLLRHILLRGKQRRPLIGAHRGASKRAPENTLAAFQAALDAGAELIELDVHLTRDGCLAVIHDEMIERTTGMVGVVGELTMAQLGQLDAGSYKGSAWAGEHIPELGDVFALVAGRVIVNVEIKGTQDCVTVLAERIAAHGMAENVIVSSFDPAIVRAVAALHPPPLAGLLLQQTVRDPAAVAREVGASLLHVKHSLIDEALIGRLHGDGLGILAWTVNHPEEMRRLAACGVDAILSDDPLLLRQTLESVPDEEGEDGS